MMKNRDAKMRERYLQKEDDRLLRKESKRISKELKELEKRLCLHSERIETQRYVHMAFVYVCETCGKHRLMWIEKGLEENCNPSLKEKSGLPHKPTPFIITCPRCCGFMRHVSTPICLSEFRPAKIGDDLFVNDENCGCGRSVFNWNGV